MDWSHLPVGFTRPLKQDSIETELSPENDKTIQKSSQTENEFAKEVREMVLSGIQENTHISQIVLEINGRKYAYDTGFVECAVVILHTLLDEVKERGDQLLLSVKKLLKRWGPLLSKYITSEDDQVEIIFALQDYCTGKEKQCFFNVFPKILHALYELDLVQEDAIWKWVDESKEDSSSKIFIKLVSR